MRLVEYTPDQLDRQSDSSERLVITLKEAMHMLLDAMDKEKNPLTDPSYTDICVIPSRYGFPDFWLKVQTIVSFAKTIHHEMQTLQHICLDALQLQSQQVREDAPKTIKPFTNALTDFHLYWFSSTINQSLPRLLQGEADVESAILSLKQQLDVLHDEKYTSLCRSSQSFAQLKPLLQQYDTYRQRLEMLPSTPVASLVATVTELSAKTKFLSTHADNILRDMAIVISER